MVLTITSCKDKYKNSTQATIGQNFWNLSSSQENVFNHPGAWRQISGSQTDSKLACTSGSGYLEKDTESKSGASGPCGFRLNLKLGEELSISGLDFSHAHGEEKTCQWHPQCCLNWVICELLQPRGVGRGGGVKNEMGPKATSDGC